MSSTPSAPTDRLVDGDVLLCASDRRAFDRLGRLTVVAADASKALTIRPARADDVPLLLELFGELAEYEHLEHELRGTEEQLAEALFGPRPAAEALIAERDSQALGYALFFPTFSSFLASTGVWLEDLFVRPSNRGDGVGRALLMAVAARVRERGGERLEWAALDWNELALGFYRRIGARTMGEWITHRLDGEALANVASEGAMTDEDVERPSGSPTEERR